MCKVGTKYWHTQLVKDTGGSKVLVTIQFSGHYSCASRQGINRLEIIQAEVNTSNIATD